MQTADMQIQHCQPSPCGAAPSGAQTSQTLDQTAEDNLFQQLFEAIDSNQDGRIDPAELAQFLENMLAENDKETTPELPVAVTPIEKDPIIYTNPVETAPIENSPNLNQAAKTPPVQEAREPLPEAKPSVERGGAFQGSSVISGDLPPWVDGASGHIMGAHHGSLLNTQEQDNIASTINANGGSLPNTIDGIIESLDQIGGFNQGQPPEKKAAGAYLTLNTLSKMETMPPSALGSENNAAAVYGALKVAGVQGDGAEIRRLLDANGGDALGLTDDQLVDLWGVNEHDHLHAVLFGTPEVYNPVHMTSLNDRDMWGEIPGETGALGGFNDKGEYPQWGWYDDALNFQALF